MVIDEFSLDQLLDDPIVQQLMVRDGVLEADVRALAKSFGRPPEPASFLSDQTD